MAKNQKNAAKNDLAEETPGFRGSRYEAANLVVLQWRNSSEDGSIAVIDLAERAESLYLQTRPSANRNVGLTKDSVDWVLSVLAEQDLVDIEEYATKKTPHVVVGNGGKK